MDNYVYALLMFEIGEDSTAMSTLNSCVECGDVSLMHCSGKQALMAYLRKATANNCNDLPGVEDMLRFWIRLQFVFSGNPEECLVKLKRIMHETEFGPRLGSLYRDVLQVEQLQEDSQAGRIAEKTYREALEQLMRSGRLLNA